MTTIRPTYRAFRFDLHTLPLAALLLLLWVGACASTTPTTSSNSPNLTPAQRIYQQYGLRLQTSATIYREVLLAVGEAHGRGLITDAQLEQARSLGHQARSALLAAQSALELYVSVASSPNPDPAAGRDLSARLLEFDRLLLQLQDLAHQGGVL
jgi:hypothetical protein